MKLSRLFKVKTRIGAAVSFVLLIGCASTVPVQEMSNARQAVRAAEDVEAARYAPDSMARARRLLDDAAGYLEKGNYGLARDNALEARHVAYKARKQALSEQQGDLGW
jgi:hypothetical protein